MEIKKTPNKLEKIVDVAKKHLRESDTKVIDIKDLTKAQIEELKENYLKDYNIRIDVPYISAKGNIKEKLYHIHITNKIKKENA